MRMMSHCLLIDVLSESYSSFMTDVQIPIQWLKTPKMCAVQRKIYCCWPIVDLACQWNKRRSSRLTFDNKRQWPVSGFFWHGIIPSATLDFIFDLWRKWVVQAHKQRINLSLWVFHAKHGQNRTRVVLEKKPRSIRYAWQTKYVECGTFLPQKVNLKTIHVFYTYLCWATQDKYHARNLRKFWLTS